MTSTFGGFLAMFEACKLYGTAAPSYPSIEKLIQWLIGPSPSLSATTDRPTVTGPDSKGVPTRSYLFS